MVRPTADAAIWENAAPSPATKERGILVCRFIGGGEDDVDICI